MNPHYYEKYFLTNRDGIRLVIETHPVLASATLDDNILKKTKPGQQEKGWEKSKGPLDERRRNDSTQAQI